MRIVLVRHGRPEIPAAAERPIAGRAGAEWCRLYEAVGLVAALPPEPVMAAAADAGCVVASDVRRALESAALLAGGRRVQVEPVLREAGLPESLPIPFPLPPGAWVVLARIAWVLDWCTSTETVVDARDRAVRAAGRLSELARTHQTAIVIGHGFFNMLIARELRRAGWNGPRRPPSGYWSMAQYVRHDGAGGARHHGHE